MQATRELVPESWSERLEAISEDLLNESVSIEIIDSPNAPMIEADHLALQVLSYDRRNDVFEVAAAQGGPRMPSVLRHFVDHPTRIAVDSGTSLAPTTIVVDGRDGVRTVIRIGRDPVFTG
jgi:Family of unknown function (DUF5335)